MLPAIHSTSAPSLRLALGERYGKGAHLIVMQHGLYGSRADMQLVAHRVVQRMGEEAVTVLFPLSNEGRTLDGIHTGGLRLADEVQHHVNTHSVSRISFVGHSLGGLYCRFAIGVLEERGFFSEVSPAAYISFATPHMGSRRSRAGWVNWAINAGGDALLGVTGRQLMLRDAHEKHTAYQQHDGSPRFGVRQLSRGRPLLVQLSDPDLPFLQGLARFRDRVAVANVTHDWLVSFSTAAIQPYNPFTTQERRMHPRAGYDHVLAGEAVTLAWERSLRAKLLPGSPAEASFADAPVDERILPKALDDPYFKLRSRDHHEDMITIFENLSSLHWHRLGVCFGSDWYSHVRITGKQLTGNLTHVQNAKAGDDDSLQTVRGFGVVAYIADRLATLPDLKLSSPHSSILESTVDTPK